MNKQELTAIVAEILGSLGQEPMVKASDYRPENPGPEKADAGYRDGDFVPDVTQLDLRKLYLVDNPKDGDAYRKMKEHCREKNRWYSAGTRHISEC